MCKKVLRVPAMALVLTLAVSLGAFAGGGGQKGSSQDVTVLTVAGSTGMETGIWEGYYWTEILKEDLGIVLEAILPTGESVQAALAARDLPDVFVTGIQYANNASQAGLMVNLDDYKAKLPNLFANGGGMLQYGRDTFSGRLDFVRNYVSNTRYTRGVNNEGPHLRWDYYKELGYPEITEIEDYLPVLKAMVDRHPQTESGQKIYGISLFSGWSDEGTMGPVSLTTMMGYFNPGGFLEVDLETGASRSQLDDASVYKRGLKFYYTANQMGILDPDSIAQVYPTYSEKGTAGRVLFSTWPWGFGSFNTPEKAAAGVGTKLVPFKNEKIYNWGAPLYVGQAMYLGISKQTKNLDKALAFLDYYYSWDGVWQLINGRKGVAWDLDENGEPYYTELGWRIRNGGSEFPNGGLWNRGASVSSNDPAFPQSSTHPGYKRRIDGLDWVKKSWIPGDTALDADWKRVMNAEDDMDYFSKHNMLADPPFAPMPTDVPEDIQILVRRINDLITTAGWKMAYARDEAEFNSLWADMVSQAKGIGVDRVNQWYLDAFNAAKASGAKYMY
jgi:putative aldouronate transport system substrate-binding protein